MHAHRIRMAPNRSGGKNDVAKHNDEKQSALLTRQLDVN